MDLLKERIMQEGRCFPGGILKVDSFVNHQMDPILMMDLAKEFVRLFQDIEYNKIITIEASGIAPAIMVGYLTHLPVVFVKKKQPKTMEGMITSVVHSFTKDRDYTVCVSDSYLTPDDHVIFIDDFLANGNASKGVMELCEKAGAKIEAMGFIAPFPREQHHLVAIQPPGQGERLFKHLLAQPLASERRGRYHVLLSLDQILIPCAIRSLAARKPSSLLCRASQPSQRAPQLAIPVRLLSIKPPSLAIAM